MKTRDIIIKIIYYILLVMSYISFFEFLSTYFRENNPEIEWTVHDSYVNYERIMKTSSGLFIILIFYTIHFMKDLKYLFINFMIYGIALFVGFKEDFHFVGVVLIAVSLVLYYLNDTRKNDSYSNNHPKLPDSVTEKKEEIKIEH